MIRMEAIFPSNNKCYEWNAMNRACHLTKLVSLEHHANVKAMLIERMAQEINQTAFNWYRIKTSTSQTMNVRYFNLGGL